jgi:hypothetical protein
MQEIQLELIGPPLAIRRTADRGVVNGALEFG